MSDLLKTPDYDLPIKTLALGGGVDKVLTSAPAPTLTAGSPTPARAGDDVLCLCVYGTGVRQGDGFAPPVISYDALYRLFDNAPEKTYSAKNDFFGYRSETGRFLSLQAITDTLYGSGVFDLGAMAPEAAVIVHSGSKLSRVRGSQICPGGRFHYPLLTSEQILSGMNPADARGEALDMGLLRTGSSPADYAVIFVVGQRNWNDMNEAWFVNFVDGGAGITIEYLPQERKLHNILYVGPLGGTLGQNIVAYPAVGGQTVEVTAKEGSLVRFNLDNNDLLNTAHMYYKFTLDDVPCGDPRPNDGFVYNTRIPLYFGAGADYPSGIILPPAKEHHAMTIRMMATGVDCPDTEVDCFHIHITE
ncbi:MAG: hypothetical protein HPZ79_03015 [Oscillospiraceae bacterium]|nr:hypothetical protein [Oscillospiraceae bacterium]